MFRSSFVWVIFGFIALVVVGSLLTFLYLSNKTIHGQVLDPQGAPIANAVVTAAGRSTFSDQQGQFVLQVPRGVWQLMTFADGYQATEQTVDVSDWLALAFMIEPSLKPNVWRGKVIAADTEQPLAGAKVEVNGNTLTTNAQGEFVAQGVRRGTQAKVSFDGYHGATLMYETDGSSGGNSTIEVALSPSQISVTVLDASSQKPLANAQVRAGGQTVTTNAQGQAILGGLDEGTPIRVQAKGYVNASVTYGGEKTVSLKLRGTFLEARVVNAVTQEPITKADLVINGQAMPVDANGTVHLNDIGNLAQVTIKAPGYAIGTFDVKGGQQTFALQPFEVKGIHLHYGIKREDAVAILEQFKDTELNAVVFDVKEEAGLILWDSQVPLAREIGAYRPRDYNAPDMVQTCRDYELYCIARLTVFKDSLLAPQRPALALHNLGGGILYENSSYWTNPAKQEVQDYHIALAKELIEMGWDEVQLDYIRYPGVLGVKELETPDFRVATVGDFLQRAADALRPLPGFLSADIFGLTTATSDEQAIGQRLEVTAPPLDYVSPMMYPSTWQGASYLLRNGLKIPNCSDANLCPYDVIYYGVKAARERVPDALVRPWLQAYAGRGFGLQQYIAQARGADDADSDGYLFWNNQGLYPDGLFKKKSQ